MSTETAPPPAIDPSSESSPEPWFIALRAPQLGPRTLCSALAITGGIDALLACKRSELAALGLETETIAGLLHPPRDLIARDMAWLEQSGTSMLTIAAPDYPAQLAALPDPPAALFLRGQRRLLHSPQLAIVGSRRPTAAGRRIAHTLARTLGGAGLCIVSGLARGIDTAAHEGALEAAAGTIAICGTGLDQCYPPENQALYQRIERDGLLLSEFLPRTPPLRFNFPRRNRIISGLARGTVVIEAAEGSGSLITARAALSQGREVFAVPGSPLNPLAAGCLELLREGAHLVRQAQDVLEQLDVSIEQNPHQNHAVGSSNSGGSPARALDKDYEMLLDALGFEPASIDDLVDRTGLPPGSVASMMLILELEGRVESRPGALFNRVTDR
ncbi:MAG TPA: DNA-processing protein DprA [Steroidobacteraceae bacterium]|nr:DNA-processing protein DprA [Steroidobacteraceae bacterium]